AEHSRPHRDHVVRGYVDGATVRDPVVTPSRSETREGALPHREGPSDLVLLWRRWDSNPRNLLTASQALYQLSYAPESQQLSKRGSLEAPPGRRQRLISVAGGPRPAGTIPGMAEAYDVGAIEKKWQERWADDGTYE